MEREQQKIKTLFRKDTSINSDSTYQNFLKKGYRVIPKLTIKLENGYPHDFIPRRMKILRLLKKIKVVKKLDLTQLLAPYPKSMSLYIAKRMISVACLESSGKELITSWSRYMKHLKSFSSPTMVYHYRDEQNSEQRRELAKRPDFYFKFLPRLEMTMIETHFPSNTTSFDFDSFWKFETYPSSVKRICFYGTRSYTEISNFSMAHLKNLKELKFEFALRYFDSIKTTQSVMNLLPHATQIETLRIDFIADVAIDASACEALKALRNLKKVRFSLTWEHQNHNLKILESLEDLPLEDLDFRLTIKENEHFIEGISDFLTKKKSLKNLKLRITNVDSWKNLKPIEDLLKVVDDLSQLTSFSILTMVNTRGPQGSSLNRKILPEINLSFDKLLSRSTPLKKFRISLHQHKFSQNGFMKLLGSLKGVASTLEKLRIDVGEYTPKTIAETEIIIDFIKNLKNVHSLKLYSIDISLKAFFSELIEAIDSLKYVRAVCFGEVSTKVTKPLFIGGVKRMLLKQGLEKFNCNVSYGFSNVLSKNLADHHVLHVEEIQEKNPSLKSWPDAPIYILVRNSRFW